MLSGVLSPAFLQAAGRAGKTKFSGLILMDVTTDPTISSVTGTDIVVTTTKNGVAHTDTYASLSGEMLAISADKNTKITITGTITELEIGSNTGFVSIKAKNTALTSLECNGCYALQELNLSANTALTNLICSNCNALIRISYPATNSNVSTKIASAITNATATDGTVYTDSAAAYYSTIATAATTKGWTIAQIPA